MLPINDFYVLTEYTMQLCYKSKSYGEIFIDNYPDLNVFAVISNDLLLAREFFDYYLKKWGEEKRQYLSEQDKERIMRISIYIYVHVFSAIEHFSKELVKRKKSREFKEINDLLKQGKPIYFFSDRKDRSIIKRDNEEEYSVWKDLAYIRNTIVHNHFKMNKDGKFEHNNLAIEYKKGEEPFGKLDLCIKLVQILMEHYCNWAIKVIQMN